MDNRRRNCPATSPDNLEESQARSNRNTVIMGNNTAIPTNGGSHSRRQRSHHHHHHHQAGPGPQYQTYNNPRSRHLHAGQHYTLQMSTQNSQIQRHPAEAIPVSSPPNPGQHQRRHHHRRHNQTFQQPQHNRIQARTIGDQLNGIRLEDDNDATAIQPGLHHRHNNRHRHHRRGHGHFPAATSHPRPARNQSHPQNSRQTQAQAVPTESSGQRGAMAQSQPLPSNRPAQTQSQPANPQGVSVQPTPSNSADERQPMVQSQPLRTQSHQSRPALTQSQPENRRRQESSTQGNQSQQPSESTLDARIRNLVSALDDIKHFQQRQVGNRNYRPRIEGRRDCSHYYLASVYKLFLEHYRWLRTAQSSTRENHSTRENQWWQPGIARERSDRFADSMISLLQRFVARAPDTRNSQSSSQRNQSRQPTTNSQAREQADLMSLRNLLPLVRGAPERSRNYQELFRLLGSLEDAAVTRLRDMTFHRSAVTRHHHRPSTYFRYVDAGRNAAHRVNQESSDDDFNDFDSDFNQYFDSSDDDFDDFDSDFNQYFDSSDDDFNTVHDAMGQIPDYHPSRDNGLSEDKIQEIPTRQFSRGAERSGSDQTSCVVCMCDFEDKQLLRTLPCFHEFHAKCVDEWFKTHRTCPVCRHDVRRTSHGRE